jgi:hypothetical protein
LVQCILAVPFNGKRKTKTAWNGTFLERFRLISSEYRRISSRTEAPMGRIITIFYLLSTVLASASPEKIDTRDFAIDTCFPNLNEIQLAQATATAFWQKHALRFGLEPRYLAVETAKVFPSEVQDLTAKLYRSQTATMYWSMRKNNYPDLRCVLIFDTRMNRFISDSGYLAADVPARGSVAHFGAYVARYIGTGR